MRRHRQRLTLSESGETPLLELDGLKTYFETPHSLVKAVDGVSFELARGRTLAVVGESGSGKTVLSRSIMGLLPSSNVEREGSVRFAGIELTTARPAQLRQLWGAQISMVFQDPVTSLNPVVRVGRQITEALREHLAMSSKEAKKAAVALLRSVGLSEPERRMRSFPHELSGGMCQRVVIAAAIACGPKLLLADEPTTGLDVTVSAQILDLIGRLQEERFMSVILVTHDLGVAAGRSDEVIVMYAGEVVERAPTATLFSDTRMPYTEALLRSAPRLGNDAHTRLPTIAGSPPNPARLPVGCRFAPRCPYVQPRCRDEAPPLTETSPGHFFACWYPIGSKEGARALADNKAAGLPAATGAA